MNRPLKFIGLLAWLAVGAASSQAAEIVLEHSAVDKLLAQAMFKNAGRFDLRRGACYAYLENPSVELKEGRIRIRSHLVARFGVESPGSCIGVGLASWTVVSGRPVANGGVVRLENLHVDNVDDGTTRMVLESGLLPALPRAIELDVMKAVRDMLQNSGGQLQATVDGFQIDSVSAADGVPPPMRIIKKNTNPRTAAIQAKIVKTNFSLFAILFESFMVLSSLLGSLLFIRPGILTDGTGRLKGPAVSIFFRRQRPVCSSIKGPVSSADLILRYLLKFVNTP